MEPPDVVLFLRGIHQRRGGRRHGRRCRRPRQVRELERRGRPSYHPQPPLRYRRTVFILRTPVRQQPRAPAGPRQRPPATGRANWLDVADADRRALKGLGVIPGKQYSVDDVIEIMKRRVWLIVVPFALMASGAVVQSNLTPNLHRSETVTLAVRQQIPESYVRATVTTCIED